MNIQNVPLRQASDTVQTNDFPQRKNSHVGALIRVYEHPVDNLARPDAPRVPGARARVNPGGSVRTLRREINRFPTQDATGINMLSTTKVR